MRHQPYSAKKNRNRSLFQDKAVETRASAPAIITQHPEQQKQLRVNIPTSVTSRLDLDSAESETENEKQFKILAR